jgi:hypothetical protein
MGDIRNQVDQAMAGAGFLDPTSADHGKPHYVDDTTTAMKDGIAGLIAAVRILADHLDAS